MTTILNCLRRIIYTQARNHHQSSGSTIFAVSSGHGKCGVTVIRVSGSNSKEALKSITTMKNLPEPRRAILRKICDPQTKQTIDKGLVLWFPGPKSFTGEDSFELQVHGSLAVVNAVLKGLGKIPGLQLAKPGEFTKRAFYNGKMDLTEVEGLADLLQAETEIQLKQAYLQSQGVLSKLYNRWREILLRSVAHIEADIDFNETEDIGDDIIKKIAGDIENLSQEVSQHLRDGRKGEILRNGVKTVILGEPNVGKSSLLNLLCQRPAAIVSPLEGTTRDLLNLTLNINGYPLILTDTAGLRNNPQDVVESEGISRALQTYKSADLVILIIDAVKFMKARSENSQLDFVSYTKKYIESLNLTDLLDSNSKNDNTLKFSKPCLLVLNKTDLVSENLPATDAVTEISCRTERGVQDLVEKLTEKLQILCGEPSEEHPSMSQERHRQYLSLCLEQLEMFLKKSSDKNSDTVLLAEHLRRALRSLGTLVGSVTTEQMLDVIFRDFCIGK